MSKRMNPKDRKEQIYLAAMAVARKDGLDSTTRESVAKKAGVAEGLVSRYFNTMGQLRKAVARRAVHENDVVIMMQMMANKSYSKMLGPEQKAAIVTHLQV